MRVVWLPFVCFLCLVLMGLLSSKDENSKDKKVVTFPDDCQDLFLVGEKELLHFRFRVQTEDQSLSKAWQTFFEGLFASLDRDRNDSLSKREWKNAPSPLCLRRHFWEFIPVFDHGKNDFVDADKNKDDAISMDEMKKWYREHSIGYFHVAFGKNTATTLLSHQLLHALDTNHDKKLSADEFRKANQLSKTFDRNRDGIIDSSEIVPELVTPYCDATTLLNALSANDGENRQWHFFVATAGEECGNLAHRLITVFDQDVDEKLTENDLNKETKSLIRLDVDKDGEIRKSELEIWLMQQPDVMLSIRWPEGTIVRKHQSKKMANNEFHCALGNLQIQEGHQTLDFQVELADARQQFEEFAQQRRKVFQETDANQDGLVTVNEAKRQVWLPGYFPLGDANGDKRLSGDEFDVLLGLQEKFLAAHVFLGIRDHGDDLFSLFDANKDGRLSQWELNRAAKHQASKASNIPRQWQLVFTRGQLWVPGTSQTYRPVPRDGAKWFIGMDENRDGVVAQQEFIGPANVFAELDSNQDGFLTVSESRIYDKNLSSK